MGWIELFEGTGADGSETVQYEVCRDGWEWD